MATITADTVPPTANGKDEPTELSQQYDTEMGLAHTTMQALKDRIRQHYDLASDYYLNLWGEHIHHGYWPDETSRQQDSKEAAQLNLIKLLLDISHLQANAQVLDVGCGIGGTSRYLASVHGCTVTGITISGKQVDIANRLTRNEANRERQDAVDDDVKGEIVDAEGFMRLGKGKVKFMELDAEKMGEVFKGSLTEGKDENGLFDAVWISEALSHFPNKALFFRNAFAVLKSGGKLVLADWFKAENVDEKSFEDDIKPIEDGMLLPPLCTQAEYVGLAEEAGFRTLSPPKDISKNVSKTWDITWSLIQNPSLWAFAFSQGRDGIAFLQAFRAMRRGYANETFRYAVIAFQK